MNPDLLIVMSPIIVLTVTMCACFFVMFVATLVSSFPRGEDMDYKFDLHEVVYIPHEAEWGRISTRSMDDGKPVYTIDIDHGFGWRKLAEHLLWRKEEKEATMPTPELPPVPPASLGENPASADAFFDAHRVQNAESTNSAVAVKQSAFDRQVGGDHYKKMAIQPLQYVIRNRINFAEGAVIKYVSRWRDKGGVEDLRKAAHILQALIEEEEKA